VGDPDPRTKRPRTERIARSFPRWARPFLRWFLGRCGECPNRILCLEDALGGRGKLPEAIASFDCRHGREPGAVPKQLAKFARERCFRCSSRPACAQYLGNHVLGLGARDRSGWPEAKARIDDLAEICIPCSGFPGCIQGALDGAGGVPLILIRHLAIRVRCRLGLIEK
jgi:hypothetical protein